MDKLKMKSDIMNYALEAGNPYLLGNYAPVFEEITAENLKVTNGEIPKDITGVFIRNGPNPRFTPTSHYHLFDGDGMLHALHIENGKASYRNRWVRTKDFKEESLAGKCLWQGAMGDWAANEWGEKRLPLKDTANTALGFHNGKLYAAWYMCGDLYAINPFTLETEGVETFNNTLGKVKPMAHVKVDEVTNEMMFFDYGPKPPYMTYGVVNGNGTVKHYTEIDLPAPRLPHDMAITENYSILMDLPLYHNKKVLEKGRASLIYNQELPSRFCVIPRFGTNETAKWFEAKSCYIYHVVNAWEEGDEIIMDCCITVNPTPQKNFKTPMEKLNAYLRLEANMYRYHFNLITGETKEYRLDDMPTEFCLINSQKTGRKTRYSYNQRFDNSHIMRFDALVKYDTEKQSSQVFEYGKDSFGSEAPFIPKPNAKEEDDGYVVTFVVNERENSSQALIFDAKDITKGPIANIEIPQRVPLGFHACWVNGDRLFRG